MLLVGTGPGTGDLRMRIGLHSGQVTAGVLRGQKSRFQLFGDTVNTGEKLSSALSRHKPWETITNTVAFLTLQPSESNGIYREKE